jgi:hypothetical protein
MYQFHLSRRFSLWLSRPFLHASITMRLDYHSHWLPNTGEQAAAVESELGLS